MKDQLCGCSLTVCIVAEVASGMCHAQNTDLAHDLDVNLSYSPCMCDHKTALTVATSPATIHCSYDMM